MRKAALDMVFELAKIDKRVVFIGSDLGVGTLDAMKKEMPDRFYMEGISEQHIIGAAAGMALEGFMPYVNTIATFLTRRCYEQIAVDVCLQNLPVRLLASGGGAVYAPLGQTHLAFEDIAIMRALPNMTVFAPCDALEMRELMKASLEFPHPMYIRFAKGGDKIISEQGRKFKIGKSILFREASEVLLVTTGVMTQMAIEIADEYAVRGIGIGVLHFHTIKPFDDPFLNEILPRVKHIVTIEEHYKSGGLGTALLEWCNDHSPNDARKIFRVGMQDDFIKEYGTQKTFLEFAGLSKIAITKIIDRKIEGN